MCLPCSAPLAGICVAVGVHRPGGGLDRVPAAIGSALTFVTLTVLLRELPAVTGSYITLLLPFGALAFGAALYDERVTAAAVVA